MLRIWLLCVIFASEVFTFPQNKDAAFVATSTPSSTGKHDETKPDNGDDVPKIPKIYEMNVFSNVSNRFCHTTITSKVKNYGREAQEATFSVVLPDSAYITGFIMEVGGKNYTAYIKEKEEAKKTYDAAVASGIGAAHVAVSARDSNRFTVSVNIEPQSKAIFYLTYEELLKRKQQYELVINIHPKQPVPNLNVEVLINETRPLKFVKTPALRSGNDVRESEGDLDPRSQIEHIDPKSARVKFNPSIDKQKEYAKVFKTKEDEGLSGQFVVQYDVEREKDGGDVLLKDGYFVHFFAPADIKPLPKHVVFVLDTSGSMWGQRIDQLKQAMTSILKELKPEDVVSIVEFSSQITVWDINDPTKNVKFPNTKNIYESAGDNPVEGIEFPEAAPADPDSIKKAEKVVNDFTADGGTNIFEALKVGIHLAKVQQQKGVEPKRQPLIMFLTDGDPTVGLTSTDNIIAKVSEFNEHIPIFSLSFGDGADRNFLQKISLRNEGFARHIYEGADASLQLQDFYKQISSPLLSNVTFKYTEDAKQLTRTHFPNYFGGGEIVICGTFDGNFKPGHFPRVSGWSVSGPIDFVPRVEHPIGDMERLWAYLTVQQLLEEKEAAKNKTENEQKALAIALKYSFVTPLTSLVVVKPNETEKAVDAEAADKNPGFDIGDRNFAPLMANYPVPISGFGAPGIPGPPAYGPGGAASYGGFALQSASGFANRQPSTPHYRPMVHDLDPIIRPTSPPIIYTSTTVVHTTTYSKLQRLLNVLTWMSDIYEASDDTITLPGRTYKLGINDNVDETKPCSNAPNAADGHCTLIHNCPKVHSILTDVSAYLQHFCAIDTYAGVCCSV